VLLVIEQKLTIGAMSKNAEMISSVEYERSFSHPPYDAVFCQIGGMVAS